MKFSRSTWIVSTLAVGALVTQALAIQQGAAAPANVATAVPAEAQSAPVARPTPAVRSENTTIRSAVESLVGSYRSNATDDQPALQFHACVIDVAGLDNAVYFEVSRDDSPWAPFRQGVMHFWIDASSGGQLMLRVSDFAGLYPNFQNAVAMLWLAPSHFPALSSENLRPLLDIPLSSEGKIFSGSVGRSPTNLGGAVAFSTTVKFGGGSFSWNDRGVDAAGKQVFGPAAGQNLTFIPFRSPIVVNRLPSDLVIIEVNSGDASREVATDGHEVAVQYTGWVLANGFQFDSSRSADRQPMTFTVPGAFIAGWNLGTQNMRVGTMRRLVIPGDLGYGERGNPRARIPGGAMLVFEVECVFSRPPKVSGPGESSSIVQPMPGVKK